MEIMGTIAIMFLILIAFAGLILLITQIFVVIGEHRDERRRVSVQAPDLLPPDLPEKKQEFTGIRAIRF